MAFSNSYENSRLSDHSGTTLLPLLINYLNCSRVLYRRGLIRSKSRYRRTQLPVFAQILRAHAGVL